MENLKRATIVISEIILLIIMVFSLIYIRGCALEKNKSKGTGSECSTEGEVRQVQCDAGQTGKAFQVCKSGAWEETFNDCKAGGCTQTVFDRDLKPLIQQKCVSCHSGFDTIDVAKSKIDEMIRRTALGATDESNSARMPKQPNPPLSADEQEVFSKWKSDGLLPSCPDQANNNPHIYLSDLEQAALTDIESLNSGDQTETRWLYTAHKSNEGANNSDLKNFEAAINKGINSISSRRGIVLAKPVDKYNTLFRFNLNDLGLTVAAWNLIEANDPVNLESNTNVGTLLKQLTNSKKPMMSVDAFLTSAFKANVYYTIRNVASDLNTFLGTVGVNQNTQIDNFQAIFLGMIGTISLNKNRLLVRYESTDGFFWQTYDVNDQAAANKNLERFPLLKATDPKNNYLFDASEILFTLPNGLMGGALFAANGKRADFAPLNVVAHNVAPPADPTIKVQSCTRCHAAGPIPKTDTILAKVKANRINFGQRDFDLINQLYRDPSTDYKNDTQDYAAALSKMGLAASDSDPISISLDSLQERDLNAKAIASYYLLTEDEFKDCLNGSVDGRAQVGSLLNGGVISFAQFEAVNPILQRDCQVGVEPIHP